MAFPLPLAPQAWGNGEAGPLPLPMHCWPAMRASTTSAVGMGGSLLGLGGTGGDFGLFCQAAARRAALSCAIWASNSASNSGGRKRRACGVLNVMVRIGRHCCRELRRRLRKRDRRVVGAARGHGGRRRGEGSGRRRLGDRNGRHLLRHLMCLLRSCRFIRLCLGAAHPEGGRADILHGGGCVPSRLPDPGFAEAASATAEPAARGASAPGLSTGVPERRRLLKAALAAARFGHSLWVKAVPCGTAARAAATSMDHKRLASASLAASAASAALLAAAAASSASSLRLSLACSRFVISIRACSWSSAA